MNTQAKVVSDTHQVDYHFERADESLIHELEPMSHTLLTWGEFETMVMLLGDPNVDKPSYQQWFVSLTVTPGGRPETFSHGYTLMRMISRTQQDVVIVAWQDSDEHAKADLIMACAYHERVIQALRF
ncbi:MAG: hypothetical protein ACKO0Z_04590 [Betaproteobacteria bacterium]